MPDEFIYDVEDKLNAMKDIRLAAGKTQQDFANLLGIDQSRIARWENGEWRNSEHIRTFIQLIRLLDICQAQEKEKPGEPGPP